MLFKKIANASVITIIFNTVFLGLGVLIYSLVARIYGPEGVGIYSAFTMFVGLYSTIAIFGIPFSLSKCVAEYEERKEPEKIKENFTAALIFVTITSLFTGLLAYYITPYFSRAMHLDFASSMIIFLVISSIFFTYSQITQAFYQGVLNALKSSWIQAVSFISILAVIVYAYFFRHLPVYVAVVFGSVAAGLFGLWLSAKDKVIIRSFSREELYKILKFALPLTLMSYFVFLSQWLDRMTLGVYLGVTEIGIFTAGITIVRASKQIPLSLTAVLVPSYSKVNVYGKEKVEKVLNLNIKIAAIFLFFMGAMTMLYAKDIVLLLYGSQFEGAVLVLQILSIGTFLSAITLPATSLITGSGHPKLNLYLYLIGIPSYIILLVLFTKHYGIIGTAVANILASLVYVFGTAFMLLKILNIKIYWGSVIKPAFALLALIVVYVFSFLIMRNSICSGIVSTVVYSLICWGKVLSHNDRNIMEQIITQNGKI